GCGYPKALGPALARRAGAERAADRPFRLRILAGASTGPELDGALAAEKAVAFRFPYQSDAALRAQINGGEVAYQDLHLSHAGALVRYGYYDPIDFAIVEVTRVREDGALVLSSSVGVTNVYLQRARRIILEVNAWQDERLEGMHDVYDVAARHGARVPIPIVRPDDRIGEPVVHVDLDRVVAVVETDAPDVNAPFKAPADVHRRIAGHIIDFLDGEVRAGRVPRTLLPLQSGVGNIANAVLVALNEGPFSDLTSYTEVIQDGMLDLLDSGKLRVASATAFAVSPEGQARFLRDLDRYRSQIILRPMDVSNHPEVIRRLGVISMNGFVEADVYGHVNSTHIVGKGMENGIGGSGDFARNAAYTIFMAPSTAKDGRISSIVPFASHVDHTEHDVMVLVTEWGLADLRGRSPREKAELVIERCAHPDYRPILR
ncbi:MAG TPA: acetyl-CoA hydrolase/transferase C-terminal domain-containing protein, partial [Anaeromyxobacteraceae bacterium]|nr:acetyl-CoA hydrolase/transferase C-terminal domain-containing protein [Anaeromyxobacteraceae bacterium]